MKKKGNWKLVVGILFVLGSLSLFGDGSGDGFIGLAIGALLIGWWYLQNKEAEAVAKKAAEKEAAKSYKFKVVGVTHNNDGGTSRQEALKAVYDFGGIAAVTFQEYTFEGMPALYILANDRCVGNVAAECVMDVRALIAKGRCATINVDKFKNEDKETIYYASIKF